MNTGATCTYAITLILLEIEDLHLMRDGRVMGGAGRRRLVARAGGQSGLAVAVRPRFHLYRLLDLSLYRMEAGLRPAHEQIAGDNQAGCRTEDAR